MNWSRRERAALSRLASGPRRIASGAADGAASWRLSQRRRKSGEAGAGGAVATGAPSGLIACEAAAGAAVCGVSAKELGEAGADGAVASGAPSGPILCEVTSVGASFSGPGANAGAAKRGALEGSGVCSLCGVARLSVAATGGSRSARSGALFVRTTLTQTAAAPASASPPAISSQLRKLRLIVLPGPSLPRSICDRRFSWFGELDFGEPGFGELALCAVDAAGGGASGARVDDSSARFNSASMSSAFTSRSLAALGRLASA